jgi:hypothetical protein
MGSLYIDESGSMTLECMPKHPCFIICIVHSLDGRQLKSVFKRFVSKHMDDLRKADVDNRMFRQDGSFKELKGSCMPPHLKQAFMDFFCQNHLFEVFFIQINNQRVEPRFYANKARAFNYILCAAMKYWRKNKLLGDLQFQMNIDERNVRTGTKFVLNEYLNTELYLAGIFAHQINVEYFDSMDCQLIQVADVFANIFYSECLTGNYTSHLNNLIKEKYIRHIYQFPCY